MHTTTKADVESVLSKINDPHTGTSLIADKKIKGISVEKGTVHVDVALGYPAKSWHESLGAAIKNEIAGISADLQVDVAFNSKVFSHAVQDGVSPISGIKNMIAVGSGKGGVGKSTVSVNLALALSAEGARVGILDADIYGPSQPRMLGVTGKAQSKDGKMMQPVYSYHLQAMSIGFLIDEESPMIWRGPMVTQALEQLLKQTAWDELDYLIIDLPPGTGDTQLTLAQRVPVSGAVIVTTPQDIALLDARKAYRMFEKVKIEVLGIVENMSVHICSQCGHQEHIFGQGGGERMASDYGISYLGGVPLDGRIRSDADGGKPTVVSDPDGEIASQYQQIARTMAARLSAKKKDFTSDFPSIVIQNT
ncbi:MAG: iron-sulfur cluster carrier protein ApbC [Acidiferrobacterales bacterium]|nr:iron-sulfur cluster carrier protein ApbC [Acidiferrobacterales bacterium]